MKQKDREMIEKIMDSGNIAYAYMYPRGGGVRQEYLISATPENIANFLGSHMFGVDKMIITDIADRLILNTCGCFIDCCPDQTLCRQIVPILAPIQQGEEPGEVLGVTREAADQYFREEDERVTMAEMMI